MISDPGDADNDDSKDPEDVADKLIRDFQTAVIQIRLYLHEQADVYTRHNETVLAFEQKISDLRALTTAFLEIPNASIREETTENVRDAFKEVETDMLSREQTYSESRRMRNASLKNLSKVVKCLARQRSTVAHSTTCMVCLDRPVSHFLDCGHTLCSSCDHKLTSRNTCVCPYCRKAYGESHLLYFNS